MITDALLDVFFGALNAVGTWWEGVAPDIDLEGLLPPLDGLSAITDPLGGLAMVVDLDMLAVVVVSMLAWEHGLSAVKLGVKVWRLLPFT